MPRLEKNWLSFKHFFLVFREFPGWNWDALSPLYRNSPFLMLDSLSDDRNISYGPDELVMEDKESHGSFNNSNIEEPFETDMCWRNFQRKERFRDQLDQSVGSY